MTTYSIVNRDNLQRYSEEAETLLSHWGQKDLDAIANLAINVLDAENRKEFGWIYPFDRICKKENVLCSLSKETLNNVIKTAINASYIRTPGRFNFIEPLKNICKSEKILSKLEAEIITDIFVASLDFSKRTYDNNSHDCLQLLVNNKNILPSYITKELEQKTKELEQKAKEEKELEQKTKEQKVKDLERKAKE